MMDGYRFDDLTRTLARATTRRGALKAMLAGLAAGAAGLRPAAGGAADTVRVCHLTGSADNPVVLIEVSTNAIPAHEAHGDVIAPDFANDPNNCGGCLIRCDDGDPCTVDSCAGGQCVHAPKDCSAAADACNDGVCQAGTGACVKQPANDGAGCDDGNACTQTDTCQGGACVGGDPVVCTALDQCHDPGSCDPATGICSDPITANGMPCETGNRCTADTCQEGACQEGPVAVDCPEPTECQQSVGCDPASGLCDLIVNQPAGFPCGIPAACAQGVAHAQDACDGAGACVRGADTACGPAEACVGATCQSICLALREECTSSTQCCQDESTNCEPPSFCGIVEPFDQQCCHITGGTCSTSCDCCGQDVCPSGRCCHPEGAECNIFAVEGCCEGLACDGGVCRTNCLPNGATCSPFAALRCCAGFECIDEVCRPECTNGARRCAPGADCCPSDRACCDGVCCPTGQRCCAGTCRDVLADRFNCGGCGDICPIDEVCVDGVCRLAVCKANDDDCDEDGDCCSGLCNGSVCVCSPGGFPAGDTCVTNANCCQGRCVAGFCVCFPAAFPPAPVANGPCFSDRDCCTGSCLLDPTGNIGLCTCRPLGVPCENQFQCCSGNCNATPFGGRVCSPFD